MAEQTPQQDHSKRYLKPGAFTRHGFNGLVGFLVKRGVNVWGSRILSVRGRKSGEMRSTPVNLLVFEGESYLLSPRGHSQWVRNLRVVGEGELRVGKRVQRFTAVELDDAVKPPLLRAYLKRWAFEVGAFFDGVSHKSSADELLAVAPKHPAFKITFVE
ncbi:nitroreductase family deazaflavin-dependent oxidoreductase [Actinokineospora pegani]|uniref:nitroreductase family deazaflavin-dependent oxidoreductase n=1 Tax=Actinokineospora pegani TaxID=2654637 RepID=UPI0012E9CB5A|nr:nitroreductase family deazaflavin-dependent oxidoreductase [Actinokineospora pegani]